MIGEIMRGKLLFVVGLATGYVLGARAGKARYEQIKAGADKVWMSQPVQAGVTQVKGFANQRIDTLSGKAADQVKKVLGTVLGVKKTTTTVVSTKPTASDASVKAGSTSPATAATPDATV
ncbi:YtxH domain-containing protein [Subtercola sp. PAMC28395]|uniref:YtxH domain-containing protein n=1 Tax=Subtercola sp. PAMC28395 TaxID=2846775 RepID=UPI001C0E84C4|nr:YtxH domain-containing protein [Subtercola sp. PAMC28395]QWT24698.1 YtxH domain-containing protein [Subtercola sp. PAMC28395]